MAGDLDDFASSALLVAQPLWTDVLPSSEQQQEQTKSALSNMIAAAQNARHRLWSAYPGDQRSPIAASREIEQVWFSFQTETIDAVSGALVRCRGENDSALFAQLQVHFTGLASTLQVNLALQLRSSAKEEFQHAGLRSAVRCLEIGLTSMLKALEGIRD